MIEQFETSGSHREVGFAIGQRSPELVRARCTTPNKFGTPLITKEKR